MAESLKLYFVQIGKEPLSGGGPEPVSLIYFDPAKNPEEVAKLREDMRKIYDVPGKSRGYINIQDVATLVSPNFKVTVERLEDKAKENPLSRFRLSTDQE